MFKSENFVISISVSVAETENKCFIGPKQGLGWFRKSKEMRI